MRFLEISDGFSINIKQIEGIRKIDDFTSKVITHFNEYTANFPYMTILALLDTMDEEKPIKIEQTVDKYAQHFAG